MVAEKMPKTFQSDVREVIFVDRSTRKTNFDENIENLLLVKLNSFGDTKRCKRVWTDRWTDDGLSVITLAHLVSRSCIECLSPLVCPRLFCNGHCHWLNDLCKQTTRKSQIPHQRPGLPLPKVTAAR